MMRAAIVGKGYSKLTKLSILTIGNSALSKRFVKYSDRWL